MNRRGWIAYALLAVAAFAAYADIFPNAFLLDDDLLIVKNEYLRGWEHLGDIFTSSIMRGANIAGSFYRPLQSLLYLIVYQIGGLSPAGYHLLNILLHCANACLVFALGQRLNFNKIAAFLAALLWALHPIHTEAVTYMSATADVLYAFFCLAGAIVLLPDLAPRRFFYALPLFVCALLGKETAIVFPLLAVSCVFIASADRLKPATYLRSWPLWLMAALYIGLRLGTANTGGFGLYRQHDAYADHISCRIFTFLATLPDYLRLLVWPDHLHPERSFPIFQDPWHAPVLAGFAIVLAAIAQTIWGKGRRGLALSWGMIWFFAADLPHSGILLPVNGLLLEHWMYLPTAGLFLGIGESLARVLSAQRMRAAMVTALIAALALGVKTHRQNLTWRDAPDFYTHIFAGGDYLPRAHNGLGTFYLHIHAYRQALEQFSLAIEQSGDTLADAHYDYGVTLMKQPDVQTDMQAAIAQFKRALEIDPDLFPASAALATIYTELGDTQQADFYRKKTEELYKRVTAIYPPREDY